MSLQLIDRPSLKERTSICLGGNAIAEITLCTEADFDKLPDLLEKLGGNPFAIGRGSNLLAQDGELPIVLLALEAQLPPRILREEEKYATISVPAALALPRLLHFTGEQGLSGLEGMMGIPGSVGGAIAMNAGSFGSEIGDFIQDITLFTPERGLFKKSKEEITSSYRNFSFTNQDSSIYYIIWEVTLKLPRGNEQKIQADMKEFMQKKTNSQPVCLATAGCVFKNPNQETPAGMLLEKCGFKGRELGGMMFSNIHANFLVNHKNGTSAQALELIHLAKSNVKENFGYDLELEVKILP